MKNQISIIVVYFFSTISFAQDCEEFKIHTKSIDSACSLVQIDGGTDTIYNSHKAFLNYTIKYLLDHPSDSCFIANRNLMNKLKAVSCDSSSVIIEDKLQNGKVCKIRIATDDFVISDHSIISNTDSSTITEIDGQFPFGAQYNIPTVQIGIIDIEIDGKKILIPKTAYSNLFYPNMNENYKFIRQIEVYESLNGQYLYMYIYGGNAAGTYFSKLIFDHDEFKSKIISDYYPISIHGLFGENFIGF